MAGASIPVKYLEDITECPICTNIFTDPRVLPCIHTFCLKCIEGWARNRKPGEQKLACPLCRKVITVSQQQVAQLPKNLFVEKLLDVKKLSSGSLSGKEAVVCEICSSDKSTVAVAYCIECQQNMCQQCSDSHKKMRATVSHRFIELQSPIAADELLVKLSANMCDKHRDKPMEVYCVQCKSVMCMMCYIKEHNSHKCTDVSDVADELNKQLGADCDDVGKKAVEFKERLNKLAEREKMLLIRPMN